MNVITCARQQIAARCPHARGLSSKPRKLRKPKGPPTASMPSTPETTCSSLVLSHSTLPPAKMRALVALYHQAETWVTPETLLDRIDGTFVARHRGAAVDTTGSAASRSITMEEIEKAKRVILEAPKMSKWDLTAGTALMTRIESNLSGSWSNNRATRERRVIEALYGVVTTPEDGKVMPGLEVVEESEEWIRQANEVDKLVCIPFNL